MLTRAEVTVRFKFTSDKDLKALLDALTPEVNASPIRRANVKLEKDGSFLVLTVDAEDTVALRSTLNAYLRWIGSTINVMSLIKQT